MLSFALKLRMGSIASIGGMVCRATPAALMRVKLVGQRMSKWTHPMCTVCWRAQQGDQVPYRVTNPDLKQCCWCGRETEQGIYMRADPDDLPFHKVDEFEEVE